MSAGVHRQRATKLVRIVIDANVPVGKYEIPGVRIVDPTSDEELGRELRTVEVRCGQREVAALRRIVEADDGMELV